MTDAQIRTSIFPTSRKVPANPPHSRVMVKLGKPPNHPDTQPIGCSSDVKAASRWEATCGRGR